MELDNLRHSCAHILASAVKKLYPKAKLGIGPAIEDGFYYDFDIPGGLREEDLERIEKLMKEEVKGNYPFIEEEWGKEKAIEYFQRKGEDYKLELLSQLDVNKVSIYKHAEFVDLCKGPHVRFTKQAKHFKLLAISGAYWKGSEANQQLVRIYGTVFPTKDQLLRRLKNLEEVKLRDHRKLGRELELFDIYYNQAGAGLVFYLPKGAILKKLIEDWEIKEHLKRGYQLVETPHIMDKKLWEKSGHLEYYNDFMYSVIKDNQEFVLKPMNCPGHILIYKSRLHSWRDLPLRLFELGTVYRHEKSGVLHGLLRVRGFTQDDAHIFCKKEELCSEIEGVLEFIKVAMEKFGFSDFTAELSTRPDKFIGQIEDWQECEKMLEEVLKNKGFDYKINLGDGAFYGPKIDIKLKDALGRQWQCATVQLDYNIPKRFNLTYRSADGSEERVVMIHRVILGSIERFFATLIEHYAGRFPFWLSPVQVSVLNVSQETKDYALSVKQVLEKQGVRVEADLRNETLQRKIREKELLKIPYMVIVGKKEVQDKNVSLRKRGMKDLGGVNMDQLLEFLKKEEEASEICTSK